MHLVFSPVRCDDILDLSRAGDSLIINGDAYDFSDIPEGGCRDRSDVGCDWILSDVCRSGGQICLSLVLPHGPDAPHDRLYPVPVAVPDDGPIDLPPYT